MKPLGFLALLAWAAYLYLGVLVSVNLAGGCTAARDLQADHVLAAADLKCKDAESATLFAGLYPKHPIAEAAGIAPSDVSATPSIRIAGGDGVFEVSLTGRPALANLDTNSVVDIGIDNTIAVKAARVLTITCVDRTTTACDAIFEVPQAARAKLTAADPSKITLAISPSDSPAGPPAGGSGSRGATSGSGQKPPPARGASGK